MNNQRLNAKFTATKRAGFVYKIFLYVFLLEMAYIILSPFVVRILAAFMGRNDLIDATVHLIPKNWSLYYWREAFNGLKLEKTLLFTFAAALGVSVIQTFISALVGYGFARFRFKGRNLAFLMVIIIMLVPEQIYGVSEFLTFRFFGIGDFNINLINTVFPMYIIAFGCLGLKQGLYIYLMREFFMGLPKDMEKAAYIDGASFFQAFFQVALPNARTIMTTVFLFSFCWQWSSNGNSYLFTEPKLMGAMTGTVAIRTATAAVNDIGTEISRNAMAILVILPLIVLFVFCQRSLVSSISRTGQAN
ncbi:MAG: carbohydrate ABC transporter permease [Clostridia bacterium]|nr:carbohydrate ABC transporter permease [Clostridia bacterium]